MRGVLPKLAPLRLKTTTPGIVLCIFLAAVLVRAVRYARWDGPCLETNQPKEVMRIAQSIASTGAFADPYPFPTGVTAHEAPVFPYLLSLVLRLPPSMTTSARVALNLILGSILCAAVYATALAFNMSRLTAGATALVLAILPPSLAVELCNDSDATLIAAVLVCIVGVTALWFRTSKRSAAMGLAWGAALLIAPVLAAVYAADVLFALSKPSLRRKIPALLLFTAIVLAPWIIRNRVRLGSWFFIRDNFGLELRVSNADNAFADYIQNAERGAMQTYHPFFNRAVADEVRLHGEPAVYRRFGHDALRWIRSHPARFFTLTSERFARFWMPPAGRLRTIWRAGSLLLAAFGLILLWKRNQGAAALLAILLAFYPLPYYLLQSYERYQFPIEWAITLLAVYAAVQAVEGLMTPTLGQEQPETAKAKVVTI